MLLKNDVSNNALFFNNLVNGSNDLNNVCSKLLPNELLLWLRQLDLEKLNNCGNKQNFYVVFR